VRVGFKIFYIFTPIVGEMIRFAQIFDMAWETTTNLKSCGPHTMENIELNLSRMNYQVVLLLNFWDGEFTWPELKGCWRPPLTVWIVRWVTN